MKKLILLSSLLAAGTLASFAENYTITNTGTSGSETATDGSGTLSTSTATVTTTLSSSDTVTLNGANGYLTGWKNSTFFANLILTDYDNNGTTVAAFTWNQGQSGSNYPLVTFSGSVSGTGTFAADNNTFNQSFKFSGDLTNFEGDFSITGTATHALTFAGKSTTKLAGSGEISSNQTVTFSAAALADNATYTIANSSITAKTLEFSTANYSVTNGVTGYDTSTLTNNTLTVSTGTTTFNGAVAGFGNVTVGSTSEAGGIANFASAVTGISTLTVQGSGAVNFTGANDISIATVSISENAGVSSTNGGKLTITNLSGAGTLHITGDGSTGVAQFVEISSMDDWTGTVKLSNVTANNGVSYGNANSTVEYNGVTGTFSASYSPFATNIILTDTEAGTSAYVDTHAGSTTINATGSLSGSGTWEVNFATNATYARTLNFSGDLSQFTGTFKLAAIGTAGANLNFNNATLGDSATFVIDWATSSKTGTATFNYSDDETFAGTIKSGAVVKTGTGALTLTGTNTTTGGITVSAGTLIAGSTSAFGAGALTVADGATVSANGNAVSVDSGTITINGTYIISENGSLQTLGNVVVGSTAVLDVTALSAFNGGSGTGEYTIFAGTVSGLDSNTTIVKESIRDAVTIGADGTTITFTAGAVYTDMVWSGTTDNTWNQSSANWTSATEASGGAIVFANNDSVLFTTSPTGTVTLGEAITVKSLTISADTTLEGTADNSLTVTGTLTIDTGMKLTLNSETTTLDVSGKAISVAGTIAGSGIVNVGTGTLAAGTLDSTFNGTVIVSGERTAFGSTIANYANGTSSKIQFTGYSGYFQTTGNADNTVSQNLVLKDGDYGYAIKLTNGYSTNRTETYSGTISGDGTYLLADISITATRQFTGSLSDFTGTFKTDTGISGGNLIFGAGTETGTVSLGAFTVDWAPNSSSYSTQFNYGDAEVTYNGDISGTTYAKKLGDGTMNFGGTTASGTTLEVSAGTLVLTNEEEASYAGTLKVGTGAKLQVGGLSKVISGNVTIDGTFEITSTDAADQIDYSATNTITVNTGGELKIGANRLSIGSGNSIVLAGGTISGTGQTTGNFSNSALDFFAANTISVTADSTLSASVRARSVTVTFDVNANVTLTASGNILGGGSISKTGSGKMELSGTNTLASITQSAGTLDFTGGTTEVTNGIGVKGGGTVTISGGNVTASQLRLHDAKNNNNETLNVTGGVLNLTNTGTGTSSALLISYYQDTNNTRAKRGEVNVSDGVINVLDGVILVGYDTAGALNISGGEVNAKTVSLGLSGGRNWSAIALSLTGGRLNVGTGGIALYGGTITVNGGTLGALGDWTSSAKMTIGENGATFDTQVRTTSTTAASTQGSTGTTITLSGILSGDGGLTKDGLGTLVLGGTNTYAGDTTISTGTLKITNASGLGASVATISSGAKLSLALTGGVNDAWTTVSNTISGAGTIDLASGKVKLTGVDSGFTGDIAIAADSRLGIDTGANTLTIYGEISGEGDFEKAGSGTVILAAENTISGNILVADYGTIEVTNSKALSSANVELGNANGSTGTLRISTLGVSTTGDVSLILATATSSPNYDKVVGALSISSSLLDEYAQLSTTVSAETDEIVLNIITASAIKVAGTALENGDVTDTLADYVTLDSVYDQYTLQTWTYTDGALKLTLAIPEPSMFGLLAGTLALALAGTRRRRRAK